LAIAARAFFPPVVQAAENLPSPGLTHITAAKLIEPEKIVVPVAAADSDLVKPAEVFPTGYVARGRKITVQMSDGSVRTERDTELSNVERNSVTLDGRKIFIRPHSDKSPQTVGAKAEAVAVLSSPVKAD
jgi:hypothetical protein